MYLLFCPAFIKQLSKIGSVSPDSLKKLLRKYPYSDDIVALDQIGNFRVLKCYLFQKKVRSLVYLRISQNAFIPVAITRKESKKGKNITKENYEGLFKGEILRVLGELEQGHFEIEEL